MQNNLTADKINKISLDLRLILFIGLSTKTLKISSSQIKNDFAVFLLNNYSSAKKVFFLKKGANMSFITFCDLNSGFRAFNIK
jgi:hypothetical protein